MTSQRLSPAMRNMLRDAIVGTALTRGLVGGGLKHAATRRALEARGLLDLDTLQPTEAGRAVFGVRKSTAYVVWHLVGPQACGKTQYANRSIKAISKLGGVGVLIDAHNFQIEYSGNPARVADAYPGMTVLMVEENLTPSGGTPALFMKGDRIIDLTDYLPVRRPGIEGIHAKLRLNQPNWGEAMVRTQAKHQYEAHVGNRSLEADPC